MKKIDFKKLFWVAILLYTHWTCYDHFKSLSAHGKNLMEWVETGGEAATQAAAGIVK